MTLIDSLVRANTDRNFSDRESGIFNDMEGQLTVVTTVVSDHLTGGVRNAGTLSITGSLITNNAGPGGVVNFGVLDLSNSTISGNQVSGRFAASLEISAGGIRNNGVLTIRNSTIAANFATEPVTGGVGLRHESGTLLIQSSILTRNVFPDSTRPPVAEVSSNFGGDGFIDPASSHNFIGDGNVPPELADGVNNNINGGDLMLGPLAINGGPTRTHALMPNSPAIDAGINPGNVSTDQRGFSRTVGGVTDIGAYEYDPDDLFSLDVREGSTPAMTTDRAGLRHIVVRTADHTLVVFTEGWEAVNLQRLTGAPAAISDAEIWIEPRSGRANITSVGINGEFMLFERQQDGTWTYTNLAGTGPVVLESQRIQSVINISALTTRQENINDQSVTLGYLVRTVTDGVEATELMLFRQSSVTELTNPPIGQPEWHFTNLSTLFTDAGFETPALTTLTGFVTPWNALHFAGVTDQGRIAAIWTAPSLNNIWQISDLSSVVEEPPAFDPASRLAVIQTSWQGINMTALDESGSVQVLWWVPTFGGEWLNSDLTEVASGPALAAMSITGFGTAWDGMNYAGLDQNGEVVVYWWAPETDQWVADPLLDQVINRESAALPNLGLASHASSTGLLNLTGRTDAGNLALFTFDVTSTAWTFADLSAIAIRR